MSLKLFRSTGYASILSAGETRLPMHPGWMILLTSVWAGFACNAALWRELSAGGGAGLRQALTASAFIAAAGAMLLSLLGWRKTLKPAALLILLQAGLAASTAWRQAAPLSSGVAAMRFPALLLPSWSGLLQWQLWATLSALVLLPAVWVWKTQVRRLSGNEQLGVNLIGMVAAGGVLALSGFLLFGGLS
jgi:lipid A ethanolaminephosphotransferase